MAEGRGTDIEIREAGCQDLVAHTTIPIAFVVEQVLAPDPNGRPLDLAARNELNPWVKDYDAEAGGSPDLWASRFDVSQWTVLSAWRDTERVGGLVLFYDMSEVEMLEGRSDLALIWDLRIASAWRRRGIGARLIAAAIDWARARGCREIKVETQNVNVGAFRFYRSQGFELRSVTHGAYPGLPDELQLLLFRAVD